MSPGVRVELMQSLDNFTCISTYDPQDIFLTLMSCNNGDHEFVKFFFANTSIRGSNCVSTVSTVQTIICKHCHPGIAMCIRLPGGGGGGGGGGVLTIFWVTGRLGPFDPPFSTYVEF